MRIVLAGITMVMLLATSASTQAPKTTSDPTRPFSCRPRMSPRLVGKLTDVAYANITVLERADGAGLGYRLAVDRRKPPQRGATHATEAELWAIIDGNGVITTGGKIVETMKDGKVVDRHIQGGVAHKVSKGDFLFIPEGVPHEVTGFNPSITMVTLEIPRPAAKTP